MRTKGCIGLIQDNVCTWNRCFPFIPFDDADSLDDFVVDDEEDEDEFLVDSLRPHRRGLQHGTAFLTFSRPKSSLHLLISSLDKTAPGGNVMSSDAGLYRLR